MLPTIYSYHSHFDEFRANFGSWANRIAFRNRLIRIFLIPCR